MKSSDRSAARKKRGDPSEESRLTLRFSEIASMHDPRLPFNLISTSARLRCTWIPKNMCSSMKLSLAVAEGVLKKKQVRSFCENPSWIHGWTWPMEPKNLIELNSTAHESVAIIRKPADRLRSALVDKIVYQDGDFEQIILPMLRHYSHYLPKSVEQMTFADFLHYLAWVPDRMVDQHFVSQAAILSGGYDRLFPFEDADQITKFFGSRGIEFFRVNTYSPAVPDGGSIEISPRDGIFRVRSAFKGQRAAFVVPTSAFNAAIASLVRSRYKEDQALWKKIGRS